MSLVLVKRSRLKLMCVRFDLRLADGVVRRGSGPHAVCIGQILPHMLCALCILAQVIPSMAVDPVLLHRMLLHV